MAISALPDRKSPTLALVNPTKAEIAAQGQRNAVEWRGALSVEAYLRREAYLAEQSLARDAGMSYWALVDTTMPTQERKVLAGCETLRKRALVGTADGTVREVICHGVGSVFCPSEFRGRGYASRMIEELSQHLRTWQTEQRECLFSVLYSDIGKQFYQRHGYAPFPSSHVHMAPRASTSGQEGSTAVRLLAEGDELQKLCAIDEAVLRSKLARRCGETGVTAVALTPDHATVRWHHAREEFVAKELLGKVPVVKGALTELPNGRRMWCVWTRMFYNEQPRERSGNTLHVLRLASDAEDEDDETAASRGDKMLAIRRLLAAAQAQAEEWWMERVELWAPDALSIEAVQTLDGAARLIHREVESIASLKWYGTPSEGGIEWLWNEKYGWC